MAVYSFMVSSVGFILHTSWNLMNIYESSDLVTQESWEVRSKGFPFLFKIRTEPGYDAAYMKSVGYPSLQHYFLGMSRKYHFIGWTGNDSSTDKEKFLTKMFPVYRLKLTMIVRITYYGSSAPDHQG